MAQTGYTPILIYSSSTAAQAPAVGNLINSTLGSELAINITDGKLFYKDNANAIQVIAWKVTPTTAGGTGLTSYTAGDTLYYASGTILSKLAIGASKTIMTSSGTAPQWSVSLDTSQGGTGVTSYTAGDLPYYATGTALSKLGIGSSTTVLTSSGTAPQWTAQSSLSVGTASNLLSNATTGVMQIVGPGAGTTRVMTIPNANFTAARTDAAQSFTGDQTLSTGNLIQGTSAKGFDFSANTGAAGKTSSLLNWYEEGTWTGELKGSSASATTPVTTTGYYTRVGRLVTISIFFSNVNTTGASGQIIVTGAPFTSASAGWSVGAVVASNAAATVIQQAILGTSSTTIEFVTNGNPWGFPNITAGSGVSLAFTITYRV